MKILGVPVLSDNYVWIIHDESSGETVVVDPAVAGPVMAAARSRGWNITQIWNTHWHNDHTGGNLELKADTACRISGPSAEANKIPALDYAVGEGDRVHIGSKTGTVMSIPAHTAGHVAFYISDLAAVFVGDTLFSMGCGRLFEGTAEQMFANLSRLAALPSGTNIYCAHEYTQLNGKFSLTVEPNNPDLWRRMREVEALRARGEPTIPTTVALERATNPFIRSRDAEQFKALRKQRDDFRG